MKNIGLVLFLFFLLSGIILLHSSPEKKPADIALSDLVTEINSGQIKAITVEGNVLNIEKTDGSKAKASKEAESSLTETLANYAVDKEKLKGVAVTVKEASGFGFWAAAILPFLLPFLLIGGFIWFIPCSRKT